MTDYEVGKKYSEVIAEYISKGYIVHLPSMKGGGESGSEGGKSYSVRHYVDLISDSDFVKVAIVDRSWWDEKFFNKDTKNIEVYSIPKAYRKNKDGIWLDSCKLIRSIPFFEVARGWYGTEEQVNARRDKHYKRMRERDVYKHEQVFGEKAKLLVLPFVRRQRGFKSITLENIAEVKKQLRPYSGGLLFDHPRYYVKVVRNGKTHIFELAHKS